MSAFRRKVMNPRQKVILFEGLPPEQYRVDGEERVDVYANSARTLARDSSGHRIDAIYIPHVIVETERGRDPASLKPRIPARDYAYYIQSGVRHGAEAVIAYPVPYMPHDQLKEWLVTTNRRYGIDNLIIVGRQRHNEACIGPSVTEAAEMVRELNSSSATKFFMGGITIDTRHRRTDAIRHREDIRMVDKIESGIDFFVSQLLFNSEKMKLLLGEYREECDRRHIKPRRVFLSFAPTPTNRTAKFIENALLEQEIPPEYKRHVLTDEPGMAYRSIEWHCRVLEEILDFSYAQKLSIPFGLCVEYVSDTSHIYAKEALQPFLDVWNKIHPD